MKVIGIMLIVLGVFGLIYGGISYTRREQVFKVGPVTATQDRSHTIPIPPIAGALALAGGIAILVTGGRGERHAPA